MEGTIQAMADAKNLGASGAWEDLKSAINALNVSLGKAGILSLLEWAFNTFRKFINAIANAPGPVRTVIAAIIGMGPALLAVGAGLKLITFALSGFVVLVKVARGVVWLWNNAMVVTRIRLGLLTVQTWLANSSLVSLGRTVWTSSIAALRGLVTNLGRASLGMLRFAFKAIVAGISGVIGFGVALWASMIPPLIAATAAVTAFTVALLANPVVLVITAVIGAFVALGFVVYKFRRQILGALKTVWKWVKGNWPLLVGILLGPFGIAGALIYKFRRQIFGVFTSIKKFFANVWGSIVGIFQDHWDKALAILFPAVGLPLLIARNWGRIVDAVDGVWSRVNNTVRGWIDAMVAFISELPGRVLDIVKDIPGLVADAIRDIPGLGGAIKVFTGIADKIGLAKGGIVPGPLGKPLLATVHGGEMVLPPDVTKMIQGFVAGPEAVLPMAPPGAGTMYT